MNKIERIVYDLVKGKPQLKNRVRNLYQNIFDLFPRREDEIPSFIFSKPRAFFGFHDLAQISWAEDQVLFCKAQFDLRMPTINDPLEIWVADIDGGGERQIGVSMTWNWHMGCRLQWVGQSKLLAFNTRSVSAGLIVKCADSGEEEKYRRHASCFSPDGEFYIGYDFYDVEVGMPGYGYIKSFEGVEKNVVPRSVYRVDLADGGVRWALSVGDVERSLGIPISRDRHSFLTHTAISKGGNYVACLFRRSDVSGDIMKRDTQMLILSKDGEILHRVASGNMVSHFAWLSDTQIFAYCRTLKGKDAYCIIDASDGSISTELERSVLSSDGHPATSLDGSVVVTDTYPDRMRKSKLLMAIRGLDSFFQIAELSSHKKFQSPDPLHHWACDLHPRVSTTGRYISFDSTHTGVRSTQVLAVSDLLADPHKR